MLTLIKETKCLGKQKSRRWGSLCFCMFLRANQRCRIQAINITYRFGIDVGEGMDERMTFVF